MPHLIHGNKATCFFITLDMNTACKQVMLEKLHRCLMLRCYILHKTVAVMNAQICAAVRGFMAPDLDCARKTHKKPAQDHIHR